MNILDGRTLKVDTEGIYQDGVSPSTLYVYKYIVDGETNARWSGETLMKVHEFARKKNASILAVRKITSNKDGRSKAKNGVLDEENYS